MDIGVRSSGRSIAAEARLRVLNLPQLAGSAMREAATA